MSQSLLHQVSLSHDDVPGASGLTILGVSIPSSSGLAFTRDSDIPAKPTIKVKPVSIPSSSGLAFTRQLVNRSGQQAVIYEVSIPSSSGLAFTQHQTKAMLLAWLIRLNPFFIRSRFHTLCPACVAEGVF